MRYWRRKQPGKMLVTLAKQRAKKEGVPFAISDKDIKLVNKCPVLGIEIKYGLTKCSNNSPTIDKFIPSKGYVPGNVELISMKANRLKSDATIKEIGNIYRWLKRKLAG